MTRISSTVWSQESFTLTNKTLSVSLCWGHFTFLHPGHIRFLTSARKESGLLCVAVSKSSSPSRYKEHAYSQQERVEALRLLGLIDHIILLDNDIPTVDWLNNLNLAHIYLGSEWKNPASIRKIQNIVDAYGDKIIYASGIVEYNSSDLVISDADIIQRKKNISFLDSCRRQGVDLSSLSRDLEKRFNTAKILVIGDTIVDDYVASEALGISAEAPILVVKELASRKFPGGASVVARHIRSLGAQCSFLTVLGDDDEASFVENQLNDENIKIFAIRDHKRTTTYKRRYIVENQKIFRVSRLSDSPINSVSECALIDTFRDLSTQFDTVVISDFGYGVLTDSIKQEIRSVCKRQGIKCLADSQCSTQLTDITDYKDCDVLTPNEKELRLSLRDSSSGIESLCHKLFDTTNCHNLVLTMAAAGFIAYEKTSSGIRSQAFPAITVNPLDVAGAGDSLLAAIAVAMSSGYTLMESASIAACVTALAVRKMGNTPIDILELQTFINTF